MSEAENKEKRYYIQCPKEEKEEAKALGARWDPREVKWYYTNPEDRDKFQKWLRDDLSEDTENVSKEAAKNLQERYYIECPFKDNEEVKKLGGRWDPKVKKWYYTNHEDKEKFKKWLPDNFIVYEVPRTCYKCHSKNKMLTYIKFNDDKLEDVVYPWDKERLINEQDEKMYLLHMSDPSIEYYGLRVLGEAPELDEIMLKKYPERIEMRYSSQLKETYAANICQHCGAMLGWNELYRIVNDNIKNNVRLKVFKD